MVLDLQIPMQSVPIITDVSLNLDQGEVYSIQHYDKVCQRLATGRWFSPVSSVNKADRHDIAEISLKVASNTINQPSIHH